jgi:hypothetical protein
MARARRQRRSKQNLISELNDAAAELPQRTFVAFVYFFTFA